MSFSFNTGAGDRATMPSMKTPNTPSCPYHADASDRATAPIVQPPGVWPPGPPVRFTGWSLLRRMANDPLGAMAHWRQQYGDMVHLRIWPEHQVIVTSPHLVRELLVDNHEALLRWERGIAVFSQLHGQSVLISEGNPWRIKRHALQPEFSPRSVQNLVPAITGAAASAMARWPASASGWPIESALNSLAMDVILRTTFSSELDSDARQCEKAVRDASVAANAEMYWPASWPDWMPWKRSKREAIDVLSRLVKRHVEARLAMERSAWPGDLLSRLLGLHSDFPSQWPLSAVRDECMTAFMAGHETAAATLSWWAWCMADNPAVQEAARVEVNAQLGGRAPHAEDLATLSYLTGTLQETLRLYPAAPLLLTRRSTRPILLGGWHFPARTMFTVPLQLMHHDQRCFPDPQVFRPERFGKDAPPIPRGAFMPFGTGPRVCLGQHLAMTEMTVITAMLLQRFELRTPNGMAPPHTRFNITLRPDVPLRLNLSALKS